MNLFIKKDKLKSSKKNSKRNGNRFQSKIVPTIYVMKDIGCFPDRIRCTLATSYSAQALGVITAPAYGKAFFLNQPSTVAVGYPTLARVYNSYVIHSSKLKTIFSNISATIPVRGLVVPYDVDTVNTLPLTVDDPLCNIKYAKTVNVSIAGGGHDTVSVLNQASMEELGGEKVTTASAFLTGGTGSSNSTVAFSAPQLQFKWYVSVETVTGANLALNQVYIAATLYQDIEFFERLPLGW